MQQRALLLHMLPFASSVGFRRCCHPHVMLQFLAVVQESDLSSKVKLNAETERVSRSNCQMGVLRWAW